MLFSEADKEFELNKLKEHLKRDYYEEGREKGRMEGRAETQIEDREKLIVAMRKAGFSEKDIKCIMEEYEK